MQKSAEQAVPDPLHLLAPSGTELNVAGPLVPAGGARTEAGTVVLPILIRCISENHTECTRSSHQPGQPGRQGRSLPRATPPATRKVRQGPLWCMLPDTVHTIQPCYHVRWHVSPVRSWDRANTHAVWRTVTGHFAHCKPASGLALWSIHEPWRPMSCLPITSSLGGEITLKAQVGNATPDTFW